jgi:hypothetical protein
LDTAIAQPAQSNGFESQRKKFTFLFVEINAVCNCDFISMTTYIDSEPSVVVGEEAIFKNAIERDIFMLIHSFAKASVKNA